MKKIKQIIFVSSIIAGAIALLQTSFLSTAFATTTVPYTVSYSARLTDSTGTPITTPQDVRFSLWSDDDFDASDLLLSGAINTSATGYAGWSEVHTVTPDSNGLFQVRLGTINTLPNFNSSTDVYLQVDVKPSGTLDTSYEVLDPDGNTANTTDRFPLDSSAFAINADTLDNHDTGTSAGNIPFLDGSGQLPLSTIPSSIIDPGFTNHDTYILDNDNNAPGSIKLQFGNTLNKFLEYDPSSSWFNFNTNLNVTGNLTTTGTINGVTISPSVVGPYNQSIVYEPEYADGVIQADGSNNNGKLEEFFIDADGVPGNNNINYYHWTTMQSGLQDMDIVVRATLPQGFQSWQSTPIQFTYRTGTSSTSHNKVDISVEDTAGNPVTLSSASNLASTSFTTTNITFSGSPTFTAGQPITIHIKMTADNSASASADAARLQLNYSGR